MGHENKPDYDAHVRYKICIKHRDTLKTTLFKDAGFANICTRKV